MKLSRFHLSLPLLAVFAVPASAQAPYDFDYSSDSDNGAGLTFNADDTFQFTSGGPYDFVIADFGLGTLDGLVGSISGTFKMEASTLVMSGSDQTVDFTVLTPGAFQIFSAYGTLTASFDASTVSTKKLNSRVSSGAINLEGEVNLSGFKYTANPVPQTDAVAVLLKSFEDAEGSTTITFQSRPGRSVTELLGLTTATTFSYSGTATIIPSGDVVIPEPSTYAALAGLVVAGFALRRRFRLAA